MFILVWLAFIIRREKKSEKLMFTKSGIFDQYPAPVFACCARKIHQIGNIFGSLH